MTAEQYESTERYQPGTSLEDFLSDVRALITDLYDDINRIAPLAQKSNIPPAGLKLGGTPSDAVAVLVGEARKRRRLHDLLSVVNGEYGADRSELADYVRRVAEFEPAAGRRISSSVRLSSGQASSVLASRTIERSRDIALESKENGSFPAAEDMVKNLNSGLDLLQNHIDLLRESHRIYGVANELTWQSRRLEQVTDLPKGATALPIRVYRDILDAVIEAQAILENLDVNELLGRVGPSLMSDNLCIQYKEGLNANKARLDKLKFAEGDAVKANELASESAWGTKDLRVFWYGFLQQLYLKFAERLRDMRKVLAALPR